MKIFSLIKHFIFILLCSAIFLAIHPLQVQAQDRAVAVVYDNSGSMSKAGQCEGINYALQVMVGLLHAEDELYVFKMQPPKGDVISLKSKQNSIDKIAKTYDCEEKITPFEGVLKAKDLLSKSRKKGKWLIILSDGAITDDDFEKKYGKSTALNEFVDDTGARLIFLDVSKKDNKLAGFLRQTNTPHETLRTRGSFEQVIDRMEEIASSIMSLSGSGVPVVPDGNNIEINSPIPLKGIIVLQQDASKNAKLPNIKSAKGKNGKLHVGEGYKAEKSQSTYRMSGLINHIEANAAGNAIIPKGKININFDGPVNIKQTKFLPEAAARLEVDFRGGIKNRRGNLISVCDSSQYVTVVAKIVDYQNKSLSTQVLKGCKVHFINENTKEKTKLTLNEATNEFTTQIKLRDQRMPMSVSAEYLGFFNFQSNILVVEKADCPQTKASVKADKADIRVKVTDMKNAPTVTVTPYISIGDEPSRPATPEELKKITIQKINDTRIGLDISKKDGKLHIKPTTFICACFTATGKETLEFDVVSSDPKITSMEEGHLSINIEVIDDTFWAKCGSLIIALITLLILLWYIWGLLRKPRFCKGSEIIISKDSKLKKSRPKSHPLPTGFFNRYLVPFAAEKKVVGSVSFKAGSRCSHVLIDSKTQTDDMFVSGFPVEEPGKKDLRLSQGEKLEIAKRNRKEIYEYHKL